LQLLFDIPAASADKAAAEHSVRIREHLELRLNAETNFGMEA
jgi:hypothetical protein